MVCPVELVTVLLVALTVVPPLPCSVTTCCGIVEVDGVEDVVGVVAVVDD